MITLTFWQVVGNIFKILSKKEKNTFLYLLGLSTLVSIADIISIAGLVVILAFYTGEQSISIEHFLPHWILEKEGFYLFMIFLFFLIFKNIGALLTSQLQYKFVHKVALRISKKHLQQILDQNYEEYIKIDSSVLVRRINIQSLEFANYILAGFQQVVTEVILIALAMGVIIYYKAGMFLGLFTLLFPLIWIVSYFIKRKLKQVRIHIKSTSERTFQYLRETLDGFVDLNIYNGKPFFINRFYEEQKRLTDYLPDLHVSQNMSSRLIEMFAIFGLFLLLLANNFLGNPQTGIIIYIGSFVAAAYKIIPGINKILNLVAQIKTFGFTTVDFVENESKVSFEHSHTLKPINSISFSDVSISYNGKRILDQYNVSIQSGDFVGISGPSGIGKTTLINIILGFLKEESGKVCFNGDVLSITQRHSYWSNIAYVKQQNFLINGTIRDNICFNDDIPDQVRFNNALYVSGVDHMLRTEADGINKIISENGSNISGGQRQRIAIARAIYKKADVYILDEPFNELDTVSENMLLNYFKELASSGCIVILVTHNRQSLSYCNKTVGL